MTGRILSLVILFEDFIVVATAIHDGDRVVAPTFHAGPTQVAVERGFGPVQDGAGN